MVLSCNKGTHEDWTGMHYFDFEISGTVYDSMGFPIEGIMVSASGAKTYSGADGSYRLKGTGGSDTSFMVSFTDVDQGENRGYFMGAVRNVTLEYVKGKHGPYLGFFRKTGIDATLSIGTNLVPDINTDIVQ